MATGGLGGGAPSPQLFFMPPFLDSRLPLIFAEETTATSTDALLLEGEGTPTRGRDWFQPTAHPTGCACCTPRNGAAMALARLILARGRGTGVFFNRVIVVACTEEGREAVRQALEDDPIVSCVCRLELTT